MVAYRQNTSTTTEIRNAEGANLDFPSTFMMVNKIMGGQKKIDLERIYINLYLKVKAQNVQKMKIS